MNPSGCRRTTSQVHRRSISYSCQSNTKGKHQQTIGRSLQHAIIINILQEIIKMMPFNMTITFVKGEKIWKNTPWPCKVILECLENFEIFFNEWSKLFSLCTCTYMDAPFGHIHCPVFVKQVSVFLQLLLYLVNKNILTWLKMISELKFYAWK